MRTNKHHEVITFYVSDLGHDDIILRYTGSENITPMSIGVSQRLCLRLSPFLFLSRHQMAACYAPSNFKAGQRYAPVSTSQRDKEQQMNFFLLVRRFSVPSIVLSKSPDPSSLSPSDEVFIAFPLPITLISLSAAPRNLLSSLLRNTRRRRQNPGTNGPWTVS